jgi:MinD-like ATPase involved in chromosome partitioning or flagellar assembly
VGAAALTARIPLATGSRNARAASCGLSFDALSGPLVAICGLTGGAGTSTLALLLARQAARDSNAPVLLTEHDAQHAGLAAIADRATPRPFVALAQDLANERAPVDTFAELADALRLIAAAPQFLPQADPTAVHSLLDEARAAHGLVVIDCGTHWTKESPVLDRATHIIWTLAATPTAVARASIALDTIAPRPGRAREALAAARLTPGRTVSVRALRRVAERRCERLVLMPYDERVAHDPQHGGDSARHALTALGSVLRSNP